MRELEGNIYVNLDELTSSGISINSVYDGIKRGSALWQSIADPCDGRRRLVKYETMADKYKERLKLTLWQGLEPTEWQAVRVAMDAQNSPIEDLKRRLKAACEKGYEMQLGKYRHLPTEDERTRAMQMRCLARSAAVVMAVGKWYNEQGISFKKYDGYKAAGEWLDAQKSKYFPKIYVRTNPTGLAEQVRKVFVDKAPIEEVVYQPRVGNENRMGENHTFGKGAVVRLLTDGKNRSTADVYRKVKMLCLLNGYGEPSESTVRQWVGEVGPMVAVKRYGIENKASARMRFSTPLARPMNAGDLWEMDGTRVQLQPHITSEGGIKSLYIVAIRDVYSGAWLGWSFARSESFATYHEALKMAVTLTGYLPNELRHDSYPGSDRDEWERFKADLTSRGVFVNETKSATGKASTERAFGTLQSVFEMDSKAWVGQGIRSSRDYNRPTKDYLGRMHKELKSENWDWEAAWKHENEIMLLANHTPLCEYSKKYKAIKQSPWELHETDSERPNVKKVEMWEMAELFWPTRKVQIRNYAIKLTVNRKEYLYNLAEERFYDLVTKNKEVIVRYETSDPSSVMLFDVISGELLHEVQSYEAIQLTGKAPEYGRLQEFKTNQKALANKIQEKVTEIQQGCDVDVLSVSMAGKWKKEQTEAAEDVVMFDYLKQHRPAEPVVATKAAETKTKAKAKLHTGPVVEDYSRNIWEQLTQ